VAITKLTDLPEAIIRKKLINSAVAAELRGVTVHELRRLKKAGEFPTPMKPGGHACFWQLGDVLDHIEDLKKRAAPAVPKAA